MNKSLKILFAVFLAVLGVIGVASFVSAKSESTDAKPSVEAASAFVRFAGERAGLRAKPPSISEIEKGQKGWKLVYEVLMSPRCMNCHPVGDKPLQRDDSVPHAMNISRVSEENGLACSTCHQAQNSEALGIKGGPPGAPNWHLPPPEMPLVFEGRSESQLCVQMKPQLKMGEKR